MLKFNRLQRCCLLAFVAPFALVGCGKSEQQAPATQVAARVDGAEISVHQINAALAQTQVDPKQADEARQRILERLIEQQVLVSKALEAKLDREPRTMQALEEARRQILAQAYLAQRTGSAVVSSQEEIAKFYKEQPDLFAQRRQFRYVEATGAADAATLTGLKSKLEAGGGLEEVLAFLKSKSVTVSTARFDRVAEQLPLPLLPRMSKIKPGQTALIQSGNRFSVVQMIDVKDVPLTEAQAKPIIDRYLVNEKRMQLAQNEVKQLRGAAKIEYLGEFQAKQPPDAPTAASPKPTAEGEANFVDKGLSGLK